MSSLHRILRAIARAGRGLPAALGVLLAVSCVPGGSKRADARYPTLRTQPQPACAPLTEADFRDGFAMDEATPYREFLDRLVREHGAERGIGSGDVRLFSSPSKNPSLPGTPGLLAGELICNPGILIGDLGRYRIVLYEDVLVGRGVSCLYNTIAHEFKHVLQDVDSGGRLRCGAYQEPAVIDRHERAADRWADAIAPACRCG